MGKYVSKPVEIQARQWTGGSTNTSDIIDWIHDNGGSVRYACEDLSECDGTTNSHRIAINTLEGVMHASVGDWIIKGTEGEFYPCKPSVFERKYEAKNPS